MLPEHRLLDAEPNTFNRMAVVEKCEIIVVDNVCISHTILTHFAIFARGNAFGEGHFIQPFE